MQFCDTYITEVEMNIPSSTSSNGKGCRFKSHLDCIGVFQYCTRHFWHSHAKSYDKCFGTTMHCTFLKRAKSRHRCTLLVLSSIIIFYC